MLCLIHISSIYLYIYLSIYLSISQSISTPVFHALVARAWFGAMLELVDDRERSLESRVLDLLRDRILLPLMSNTSASTASTSSSTSCAKTGKHNEVAWLAFSDISTCDIERFGQAVLRLSQVHDLNVKKLVPALEAVIRDTEWQSANSSGKYLCMYIYICMH
jgi:hypothetical protein